MIIAVVDDTMQDRELLKGMLDQYFSGIRQYLRFKSLNPEKHF